MYLGLVKTKPGPCVNSRSRLYSSGVLLHTNLWMRQTLQNFSLQFEKEPIYRDNTISIGLRKNPIQHSKAKHIEIRTITLGAYAKGGCHFEFVCTLDQLVESLPNL